MLMNKKYKNKIKSKYDTNRWYILKYKYATTYMQTKQ